MSDAIAREAGHLERDGERIYWERLGAGPPLVLCHGLGGNHAVWFQQVAAFARTRQVVVWDQRGFGRSTDRGRRSGPEIARVDLAALLDHLGVSRAELVGQSMGGWAALGFALDQPDRVERLVLADSLGGLRSPGIDAALAEHGSLPAPDGPGALGRHPALDPSLAESDPARAWLYQALGGMGEPDVPDQLSRLIAARREPAAACGLPAPILFVVGERDPLFPPAVVRAAAAELPGARVVEIPDCGHSPYFEQPAAWNAAVAEFLEGGRDSASP